MKIQYGSYCTPINMDIKDYIDSKMSSSTYNEGQIEHLESTQTNISEAVGYICNALAEQGILKADDIATIGIGYVPDNVRLLKG